MGFMLRTIGVVSLFGCVLAAQPTLTQQSSISGNGATTASAMAVDKSGNIYLAGTTTANNLASSGAFRTMRASSTLNRLTGASAKYEPLFPPVALTPTAVVSDPRQNGVVYALSAAGLYQTTDSGDTWTRLTNQAFTALGVAAAEPSTLYAQLELNIQKSDDGGATWTATAALPAQIQGNLPLSGARILVDPYDAAHVIVNSGILACVSTDGGATWSLLTEELALVVFDPALAGRLYAIRSLPAGNYELLRSTDGGASFVSLPTLPINIFSAILPSAVTPGQLYVSGMSGSNTSIRAVFSSSDAGDTWRQTNATQMYKLFEDRSSGQLMAFDYTALYLSSDGFQTLEKLSMVSSTTDVATAGAGRLIAAVSSVSDAFVAKLDSSGNVVFATYLGGLYGSTVTAIAAAGNGDVIVGAMGTSADLPETAAFAVDGYSGGAYLMRLSADGGQLLYSTRITGLKQINGIHVDVNDRVYLAGTAYAGMPVTASALQPYYDKMSVMPHTFGFVMKLEADGLTPVYSTYLGEIGIDRAWTLTVNDQGEAYVAGTRLWRLNADGSDLRWSTTLYPGEIFAGAVDADNNYYVCGGTWASGIYTTPDAFQHDAPTPGSMLYIPNDRRWYYGNVDAFVSKFGPNGDVVYSTLLAGSRRERCLALALDGAGGVIVAGDTTSTDFPLLNAAQDSLTTRAGFLAHLNTGGSAVSYSTFTGGGADLWYTGGLARLADGTLALAGALEAYGVAATVRYDMDDLPSPRGAYATAVLRVIEPSSGTAN